MELFHAHQQWATRPADERFPSLEAMHQACQDYAQHAAEAVTPWKDLQVVDEGEEVRIVGPSGNAATVTHYAFGQLCARAQAPSSFLRELPAKLAADSIAYRLRDRNGGPENAQILFHANADLVVRAVTGEAYVRIWNWEVLERLIELSVRYDLIPARQTMTWDGTPLPPEELRPPALYASDHDMFAFLMGADRVIRDPVGQALHRGVIVVNSEVGDCALKVLGFYFRDICCNHIIWGAQELCEIRLTHVGQIRQRWIDAAVAVRRYLDSDTSLDQAAFKELTKQIAGTKDEVLDAVFGKRIQGLSRKAIAASLEAVVPEQDGDPLSRWGLAQGITRFSQTKPYGDDRTELDRAAGKLLRIAF